MSCFQSSCLNWCPPPTWWQRMSGEVWECNRAKAGSTTWFTNQVQWPVFLYEHKSPHLNVEKTFTPIKQIPLTDFCRVFSLLGGLAGNSLSRIYSLNDVIWLSHSQVQKWIPLVLSQYQNNDFDTIPAQNILIEILWNDTTTKKQIHQEM